MLQARPDLIQAAQARTPLQLEAEVVEDEPQEPEPTRSRLAGLRCRASRVMRFRVDDESILPAGETRPAMMASGSSPTFSLGL